ncbi:MAG: hypothetical protein OXP75_06800 [Rhodospirillales bacterium]|nr:hypothetical protein [Rhodospirillales bacterium]
MAVDALPTAVAALQGGVAAGIKGAVLGSTGLADAEFSDIAGNALFQCYCYAPGTPLDVLKRAAIRYAGWDAGRRPHALTETTRDPSGTELTLEGHRGAIANGMTASGAGAMLSPWRVRRGGLIEGAGT